MNYCSTQGLSTVMPTKTLHLRVGDEAVVDEVRQKLNLNSLLTEWSVCCIAHPCSHNRAGDNAGVDGRDGQPLSYRCSMHYRWESHRYAYRQTRNDCSIQDRSGSGKSRSLAAGVRGELRGDHPAARRVGFFRAGVHQPLHRARGGLEDRRGAIRVPRATAGGLAYGAHERVGPRGSKVGKVQRDGPRL